MKLHVTYFSEKTTISVRNEIVEVKAFQVIVWLSVSADVAGTLDPNLPKLPAILDIGTTHNFAITSDHLMRWAGISAASLRPRAKARIDRRNASLRAAGLWLHMDAEPLKLNIDEGIAILEGDWPRLPILGLRALTNSKLQTFIYGDTRQVLIRTPPPWYWPF